jgi:CheY-like chemotaxis protein
LDSPDILVSDVGMPEGDGDEFIRKARLLGEPIGRVRAIALTAFAKLDDRIQTLLPATRPFSQSRSMPAS